jgi:hypothetical protein
VADIYAQVAVLSRVSSILEDGAEQSAGQEGYLAETFCARAAGRVDDNLGQIEANDDERMSAVARSAYERGQYGYAFL